MKYQIKQGQEKIKVKTTICNIIYTKDNFSIFQSNPITVHNDLGEYQTNLIFKGSTPYLRLDTEYTIVAHRVEDKNYGEQYNIDQIYTTEVFKENDKLSQKKFLQSIFNENQIETMYTALDDPYKALKEQNMKELVKIKGCGMKTAIEWCDRFKNSIPIGKIYTELAQYNLTPNMVRKLMDALNNSPDLVIETVQRNPYVLVELVKAVGFKTADKIALDGGMPVYDERRVSAFMLNYLRERSLAGMSWISYDEMMGAVYEYFGDGISVEQIQAAIIFKEDKFFRDNLNERIGLKKIYDIEDEIAKELIRLRNAESVIEAADWEDSVKRIERKNGWEFTDEQMEAIRMGVDNNVMIITALAGSGKTSAVEAILTASKDYPNYLISLSGRAASRMSEITGQEGSTIHRLLGYSPLGFEHNANNPLPIGVYVLDETSMVGARLFLSLLKAMPDGSKLIMLGDVHQLESIGEGNVFFDIINSKEIPCMYLTKIHRQAAKSAIITESIKVTKGEQLIPKDYAGKETRGELQDLHLNCFSDSGNTLFEVTKQFTEEMSKPDFNIMECQIITPIKARGQACTKKLNEILQDLYNPKEKHMDKNKNINQMKIFKDGDVIFLREGDKVINTVNNYKTVDENGDNCPIFNGSMGIVSNIDLESNTITIDFAYIGRIIMSKETANTLDLGYAITVHKMQGSQSDTVIFALDMSAYSLLTRELVYTAISRAKKECHIIAQNSALRMAVGKVATKNKQTFLQERLYETAHPRLIF